MPRTLVPPFGVLHVFRSPEGFVGNWVLMREDPPLIRADHGKVHVGLQVGLVEAGEDAIDAIGLKVRIEELLCVVGEADEAGEVLVKFRVINVM
jgi:hypothetical protein